MTEVPVPPLDEETLEMISKLTKLPQRKTIVVWGGDPGFVTVLARSAITSQIKVVPLNEIDAAAFSTNLKASSDRIDILEASITTTQISESSVDLIVLSYLLYRHFNPVKLLNEVIRLLSPSGLLLIVDYRAIPLREFVGLIRKKSNGEFPDGALEEYAITNKYSTEDIGILLDLKSFMILKCIAWRERQLLLIAQHW
ncbi:MAG: class I SAM-dependent methyltransferase [Candidatus Hodarchaeota archaeon]